MTAELRHKNASFHLLFAALALVSACNRHSQTPKTVDQNTVDAVAPEARQQAPELVIPKLPEHKEGEGGTVIGRDLPRQGSDEPIVLSSGGVIPVIVISGERYLPVELAVESGGYAQMMLSVPHDDALQEERAMASEMARLLKVLSQSLKLYQLKIYGREGFATAIVKEADYIHASQTTTKLPARLIINPVVHSGKGEALKRVMANDVEQGNAVSRASLSGLERIGEPAFVAEAEKTIGEKVDGSSVRLGVADTGITYNHPTFFDESGKSRIDYMKDSSGEGRAFFHPTAKFEISETFDGELPSGVKEGDALSLTAEFIEPTKNTQFTPQGDKLSSVTKMPLLVSAELKAQLLANPGAKLAAFSEESFSSSDEKADINQNGKVKDRFWALLVPSQDGKSQKIYIDFTAVQGEKGATLADFRKSVALGSFNETKETVAVYSEKIGVEIKGDKLPLADGSELEVVSASLVGFDPGNHGSHVAGISSGRKTLLNDSEGTRARGVAPASRIMMNRVCSNNAGCSASAAMIDLARSKAEVVNMSLGGLGEFNDGYGVQETLVNRLTVLYNTLFVISAGNSGPGKNTVGSPSTARHSLSVAATATRSLIESQYQWPASVKSNVRSPADDFVLFFSSRGPTAAGGFKPSISAPGTELSAIQLNAAPGARSGLDVYWGTSMAAPTASGAAALLLDAVKKFNAKNPQAALPTSALTLRNALVASARPFDATLLKLSSGEKQSGQYTWIDQGTGMIDLPAAWQKLASLRDSAQPQAVVATEKDGKQTAIALDYQVRVLRKNPNGIAYDGSLDAPVDAQNTEPRFGTGIWLDANDKESLVPVQIVRALPFTATRREDVGELARLLNTSFDEFEIETTIHGSHVPWLKAGGLTAVECHAQKTRRLAVIGQGAVLVPKDAEDPSSKATSTALGASVLNVCVDRAQVDALPAGDHGAIIELYRVGEKGREAVPSVVVPVYLSKPHATLAGSASYKVEGSVQSFGVSRNYIVVPEGTSLVEVEIEVPAAKVVGNDVRGCGGVELMIREGKNTATPAELSPRTKAIAQSCELTGRPSEEKRKVRLARSNPNAGVWDIHVFGRYQFPESAYTLKVTYAKVEASQKEIVGELAKLRGEFTLKVLEASSALSPDAKKSTLTLSGIAQDAKHKAIAGQDLQVPNADGAVLRSYGEDVAAITIATGGSPGNDIDLVVEECNADGSSCAPAGQSGSPTDVESVTLSPKAGKAYRVLVNGYDVQAGKEEFTLTETQKLRESEQGTLAVSQGESGSFLVTHDFDLETSKILARSEVSSGKYSAVGELSIKSEGGAVIARLPVKVASQQP